MTQHTHPVNLEHGARNVHHDDCPACRLMQHEVALQMDAYRTAKAK
jgi:hypothetical protein